MTKGYSTFRKHTNNTDIYKRWFSLASYELANLSSFLSISFSKSSKIELLIGKRK